MTNKPDITALARVVYSGGRVFDGLRTGRLDTEKFLRSGETRGITSKTDLMLLEDLRDVARLVVERGARPVDAAFVTSLNAAISRSGSLHPGELRTSDQRIGVSTRYGRHEPPAMTDDDLQQLIADAMRSDDVGQRAIDLFVAIAKAQPFGDGNKRTALFAANALLLGEQSGVLLTVPVDEQDPSVAERFNDLLARAYVLGEDEGVKRMLLERGLVQIETDGRSSLTPSEAEQRKRARIIAQAKAAMDEPDEPSPTGKGGRQPGE